MFVRLALLVACFPSANFALASEEPAVLHSQPLPKVPLSADPVVLHDQRSLDADLSVVDQELAKGFDPAVFHQKMSQLDDFVKADAETLNADNEWLKNRIEELSKTPLQQDSEDAMQQNANTGISVDLFEGDVLLTADQLEAFDLHDPRNATRARRQAQKGRYFPSNTWKGMTIPYTFAPGYPSAQIPGIKAAIGFWERATCIRFQEGGAGSSRVRFINGGGCYSNVGRLSTQQDVSIGQGCESVGIVAHELGHTIGLWHVQSRYDRDRYLSLNTNNIQQSMMYNFAIAKQEETDLYNIPYEFGSNMHYHEADFGIDSSKPTQIAQRGYEQYQHSMGSHLPTFYDVQLVNLYYDCYAKCTTKVSCYNGGLQDVNNCNKCYCPIGFIGNNCEKMENYIGVTDAPRALNVTIGTRGKSSITAYDTKTYVLQAPAGKRVWVIMDRVEGIRSSGCSFSGMEVRTGRDPAMAGIKACLRDTDPKQYVSSGERMVLHFYSRYETNGFHMTIRAIQ